MEAGAGLGDGVPRPGRMAILAVVLGAVVIGVIVGVGAHLLSASNASSPAARPSTGLDGEATWAAGQTAAPPINTLHDQSGHVFSLASLHGRPVAMEFFDSRCKQECPLAGRALAAAERGVAPAQRPVLVVVSVNPLDTPASTRAAVRSWGLARLAPWYWLRGTHAQLAPVWSAYHIFVKPMRGDISHTEALYLIDRRGDERSGYLYPYIPFRVAHDMRMLAARPASSAARGSA
jgi:protein SCO1